MSVLTKTSASTLFMYKILAAVLLFLISLQNSESLVSLKDSSPPAIASYYITDQGKPEPEIEPFASFIGSLQQPFELDESNSQNTDEAENEDNKSSNSENNHDSKVLAFNENSEKTVGV